MCSAAITVSAAAGVHTFILSVFFMPTYSFRWIKRWFYIHDWALWLPSGSIWFRSLEVEVNSTDTIGRSSMRPPVWQSYWEPWHLREIAPLCVSIFSQSLLERWRRGPCHTRRCCEWKPTARQRWTRSADPDSTAAVGWAPASGPCSPVTLYHPWVCSALRRTTWVKVKKIPVCSRTYKLNNPSFPCNKPFTH